MKKLLSRIYFQVGDKLSKLLDKYDRDDVISDHGWVMYQWLMTKSYELAPEDWNGR